MTAIKALKGTVVIKWRELDHFEAKRHAELVRPEVIHEHVEPTLRIPRGEHVQVDDEIRFSLLRRCHHFRPRHHEPPTGSVCRPGHSNEI